MFSAWWNQPRLGRRPIEAAACTDNESPGESEQLPVTGFADLIAWNSSFSAASLRQFRLVQAKKPLSCLKIGLHELFQFVDRYIPGALLAVDEKGRR